MASAKKAAPNGAATAGGKAGGGAPRRPSSGIGPLAPLEPTLYPEREMPAVPTFTVREATIAKNHSHLKQRTRIGYFLTATRQTRDIRRYSDRFLKHAVEEDLTTYLAQQIAKGMFPNELIKKTVLRKRRRSAALKDVDLNELGEEKEGDDEDEEGEEGGEGKKKKKATGEKEGGAESESDSGSGSDESDGGVDYGKQDDIDDDDEGMDDDGDDKDQYD